MTLTDNTLTTATMWAVFGPRSGLIYNTLSSSKNEATSKAMKRRGNIAWLRIEKMGYTCKQVRVTIELINSDNL